ncbi:glycosyltransferase [Halodesulfurarchaeum sp. HSR-GB]|uniref:glycosyltransferase n=1 Tax=Halodesulfurarchaeum sp. HSR-GB TaxID=3074077 RepID=UPI0028674D25|nr:glycosyltransferase [Halodesulfurarchaeum sp. HSR-GB]MDR5657395.1 glycosyltransferase [Halodesulfurarchaeum sp. HSR-GB]
MSNTRKVGTVIPIYNDSVEADTTLNAVTQLSHEKYNIFVVDNNSTDGTQEVIAKYTRSNQHIHLLVEDEIQSSYAARNTGIANTDADILAFLDADETVDPDWLETAIEAMESQNVDYLGCNVELTLPDDTLVGHYNQRTGFPVKEYLENEHFAPTCALLVRREVFEDVGLFDERLISGGDMEFGQRVHEAGYDQGYAEDATVYHPARTSFESLWKKNFRVGRGFCQKQRYHPDRYGNPGIPPTPTGSGSGDEEPPEDVTTRVAFALLSIALLVAKGLGYYYEFFFGEERERRDFTY